MRSRFLIGLGLLISGVLFGLSCSGPEPEGRHAAAGEGGRVYHVQLDATKKKGAANRMLGRALEWWNERADSVGPRPVSREASPVTIAWRAPLYRVQLGPFASREAANDVLAAAQAAYPEAFISPKHVSPKP